MVLVGKGKLHCLAIGQIGHVLLLGEETSDAIASILFKTDEEACPNLICQTIDILDLETKLTVLELATGTREVELKL